MVFDNLPLGVVLEGEFFVVHGGISPSIKKISDINKVN